MTTGTIYLIPCFLGEDRPDIISDEVKNILLGLDEFIVENAKTARRFLRAVGYKKNFDTEVILRELNKHGSNSALQLLENVLLGKNIGIISEAGNPCIADPGNEIVRYAHKQNINVVPLAGPSSILLALIASGFNGQLFSFHGYLPIEPIPRAKKIKQLEENARTTGTANIFMETPYRNGKLLEDLLKNLNEETALSIACDLTLSTQYIGTKTIREWKQTKPDINKRYCVFVIGK
jgi:16S rRNA (cytidine1402-2'-O)-methyltransferase